MYLICKLLYIALFALVSAAPPYLPLYYHDILNLSSDQIGFVLAIAPFIQSISCPIWTYLVDKKPALHGTIMAITGFLGASAIMMIMLIGRYVTSEEVIPTFISWGTEGNNMKLSQLSSTSLLTVTATLALAFAFFALPNMSLVDSAVMKILGPNKLLYGEQRLWGSVSAGATILLVGQLLSVTNSFDVLLYVTGAAALLFMLFSFMARVNNEDPQCTCVPEALLESAAVTSLTPPVESLDNHQHQASITGQNLKPVITDSSEKLLNNYNNSAEHHHNYSHYGSIFKATSITSVQTIREEADETLQALGHSDLGLAISRIASVDPSVSAGLVDLTAEGIPAVENVLKSVRVITFLATTLFFGLVLSVIVNFLFLFLSRDLHMPASWIGWTGPTSGVTELLCFCFSKQLTEKFGVTNMMLIAHIATILRCLMYTILQPDSLITNITALLLQTLHGVGFGIFWATSVSEIDGFFPPEQRSVAQGILGALHFGVGAGMGAFVGGYLYEYYGAVCMFRIVALIAASNMAIFYLGRLHRFK
ncbi:major facilitator superfamily domain-containing protein [Mycotypha africana]|uniref:major facilitator superfamily domain-containing protein n=1 Tax=Mycotypha africana TaxID=64632 RepID=UPI0023017F51|nr:major facilitator superfamily domain-containing protein [Mycotypha africana]KAI8967517.1 major facilitator superfamily domain-containing protein [Mycotypha africana]